MAVLEFIFATPWHFAGSLILLCASALPLSSIPALIRIGIIHKESD